MSGTDANQVIRLSLQAGQQAVVTREGWRVEFNKAGGPPQITHNGRAFTFADGAMVPFHAANAPSIDGAPAVLWHRTNGRLTKNDIAKTICDNKDNPIGIYIGVWTPEWAKGREILVYAAITDALDGNGDRLYRKFNQYVAHLNSHPDGEKLSDRLSDADDATYEMAMQARILALKAGERTGQMIPSYGLLLRGQEYSGKRVMYRNSMYDLRYTGDFAKADNGGFDSRFVTESGSGGAAWYVSSSESLTHPSDVYGANFMDGSDDWGHKDHTAWSLRPFIAEISQP